MFSDIDKKRRYVLVTFSAYGCNAINSYFIYGVPSPFTFWGFAHALNKNMGTTVKDEKIFYVINKYENRSTNIGYSNVFHQIKSTQRDGGKKAQTQTDIPRYDIRCSILFLCEMDEEKDVITKEIVKKVLLKMKFGGGVIDKKNLIINIADEANEDEVLMRIPRGYIAKEVKLDFDSEDDKIDKLIDEIKIKKGEKTGWKIPTLLGYLPIEEPQKRENARSESKYHQFAEPFVGIIELKSFKPFGDNKMCLKDNGWRLEVTKEKIQMINQ